MSRLLEHLGEHIVQQQSGVLREHAEDKPVDEVRHGFGLVAPTPEGLNELRKRRRSIGRQRLARHLRPQPLGVAHCPLEHVASSGFGEVFERKLVDPADAVRPVGADAEAGHVGDDEERRVFQREGVLPQLSECGVEIGVLALVFPSEVVALPHVSPALAALVLARAALEAIALAGGIGVCGRGLAEHAAQIDEVLLGRGAFLEF